MYPLEQSGAAVRGPNRPDRALPRKIPSNAVPIPALTKTPDQHAVVTVNCARCACDGAGL